MRHTITIMMRHIPDIIWSLLIGLLIVCAIYLSYLVYMSYFIYHINLSHGADSSDIGMNQLAVVYFLGNTLVALIAAFSITFARRQLKHAEASRRASIYMEIYKRVNSNEIKYSFRKMAGIMSSYDTCKQDNETMSQYAHRIFLGYHELHVAAVKSLTPLASADTEYSKTMAIIVFLEDIGVLIARRYLHSEDIFDYIGLSIITTESIFKDHIIWIRKNRGNDPSVYANALSLIKKAKIAQSRASIHSFNEGDYRIVK